MEYPIELQSGLSGTLTETAEGLYTVFHADCPRQGGLVRLWLHGGGQSACLGLLSPDGERLTLTRRLSRRARSAYPRVIERVTDTPSTAPPAPAPESDARWRALPDGSLLSEDGRRAIPARFPANSPLAGQLLRIAGREYLVFSLPIDYN